MDANNSFLKMTAMLGALFISANSFAAQTYPAVSICDLLNNMDVYSGEVVDLHSEVRFTEHGRQLFDPKCSDSGSMGLSIDDRLYGDKKTIQWIRKIFSQGGHGEVRLVGRPVWKPFDHFRGYFVLQKIIE